MCYLNITDPAFYKTCDYPDSDFYIYSIHGFDPCYFLDFTSTYDVHYTLNCIGTDAKGFVTVWEEGLGLNYIDVTQMPVWENFTYSVHNEVTGYKAVNSTPTTVNIDVRDMKWLSQYKRFYDTKNDTEFLSGRSEGVITVDLSNLID